jgi:hypothetical protein
MRLSQILCEPFLPFLIGTAGQGLRLLAVYMIAGAAVVFPLTQAEVPPLVDYPNHLARNWILAHGAEVPAIIHMNCRTDPTHEQFHSEASFRPR